MDSGPNRRTRLHKVGPLHPLDETETSPDNSRLCTKYGFEKPNDRRALDLMNAAAKAVTSEISDITIAYGVSDEYRYESSWTEPDGSLGCC